MAEAISVRLTWTVTDNRPQSQVLHFYNPAPIVVDQTLADNIAAEVDDAMTGTTGFRSFMRTSVNLAEVAVRDEAVPNQPEYISEVDVAGTSSTDLLPVQTALCVTLRTAKAGRSFRGRLYFGGFAEGASGAAGRISENLQTGAADFVSAVAAGVNSIGGGLQLGVLSRTLDEINVVTSITVRDRVWDTQRRRARELA